MFSNTLMHPVQYASYYLYVYVFTVDNLFVGTWHPWQLVYRMLQIIQLPFSLHPFIQAAPSSTKECLCNTCPYFLGYKKKEKEYSESNKLQQTLLQASWCLSYVQSVAFSGGCPHSHPPLQPDRFCPLNWSRKRN